MPPVSTERQGIHIVSPTPQSHWLTMCDRNELFDGEDAVSVHQSDKATCPQCIAIFGLLLDHALESG